jgi:hypothetical protein
MEPSAVLLSWESLSLLQDIYSYNNYIIFMTFDILSVCMKILFLDICDEHSVWS